MNGISSLSNTLASKVPEMPSQLPTMPTTSLYNAFGVRLSPVDPQPLVLHAWSPSWYVLICQLPRHDANDILLQS